MAHRVLWNAIESFLFPTPQPGVCVQCHRTPGWGGFIAHLPKEGIDLEFCSQHCGHKYWADYKRHCERTAGRGRVCSYPGCNKPCYREGYKVHDYCGRTHAKEHKAMIDEMERDRRKQHYGGGGSGGRSSGPSGFFKQNGPIKFYNRGEPYYEFTNFYEVIVVIDEKPWPTTEHYFQSQKFVGTPLLETIRMLSRPREAFDLSRDPRYSRWRRPDWEHVKEDVMYKALQAKFSQHQELRQMLLDTGERKLIEHSPHDSYWGDGGDGTGKNRLGYLLMRLRDEIKASSSKKKEFRPSPSPSVTKLIGKFDKQRIDSSSTDGGSSKPADRSYSSVAQGGTSGGAGLHGQSSKPNSFGRDHKPLDHSVQQQHGPSPKEPGATQNFSPTRDMVISNMGAMTQPPPTSAQGAPMTVTWTPHSSANTPTTTANTNTTQWPQVPHNQASVSSGSHVPQSQQPQSGLPPGPVVQPSSTTTPTLMSQGNIGQGNIGQPWSGMTVPSQHPQQRSPVGTGYAGSSSVPQGTLMPGSQFANQQQQPGFAQGPAVTPSSQFQQQQPSLAQGPVVYPGSQFQQQQQALTQGSVNTPGPQFQQQQPGFAQGTVATPGSQFQHQQVFSQGAVPYPPASQPLSMSSGTAMMTGMSQHGLQQHTSMGTGLLGQNRTPPPGFGQSSGGPYLSPTSNPAPSVPLLSPNGAHPQVSHTLNYPQPTVSGAYTQSSLQPGVHAQQQTTPNQSQQNYQGNGAPEPMDTSYI